jgi:ACR3 family arsenite efflux pump ArsB
VFKNRVLRRIFGPKRKGREAGEDCIMRSFITSTLHQLIIIIIIIIILQGIGHSRPVPVQNFNF